MHKSLSCFGFLARYGEKLLAHLAQGSLYVDSIA